MKAKSYGRSLLVVTAEGSESRHGFSSAPSAGCHLHLHLHVGCRLVCTKDYPGTVILWIFVALDQRDLSEVQSICGHDPSKTNWNCFISWALSFLNKPAYQSLFNTGTTSTGKTLFFLLLILFWLLKKSVDLKRLVRFLLCRKKSYLMSVLHAMWCFFHIKKKV